MSTQASLLILRQAHAYRLRWSEDERDRNLWVLARMQAVADHAGHLQPWVLNRAGICCQCGARLDAYDTKQLERGGSLRIMCTNHEPAEPRLWYLWTDG